MHHSSGNNFADHQLVNRALAGDSKAFGQIIRDTERLVAQIVYKMVSNPEDRKDLAQDVYLKAYRSLNGFRFEAKLSTWIASIAYHTCLDHLKKKKLVTESGLPERATDDGDHYHSEIPDPREYDDVTRKKELAGILDKEIRRLSPIYQTLIVLYHKEEYSYEEIEIITGMPMGTIKNYLFRARRELKNNMLSQYKKEEL